MALPLSTSLKAEAASVVLYKLTGRRPAVRELPGGKAQVFWTENDLPAVRAWFEKQVSRAAIPPDVSIDLIPVVSPYAARKVIPAALLLVLAGVVVGRLL